MSSPVFTSCKIWPTVLPPCSRVPKKLKVKIVLKLDSNISANLLYELSSYSLDYVRFCANKLTQHKALLKKTFITEIGILLTYTLDVNQCEFISNTFKIVNGEEPRRRFRIYPLQRSMCPKYFASGVNKISNPEALHLQYRNTTIYAPKIYIPEYGRFDLSGSRVLINPLMLSRTVNSILSDVCFELRSLVKRLNSDYDIFCSFLINKFKHSNHQLWILYALSLYPDIFSHLLLYFPKINSQFSQFDTKWTEELVYSLEDQCLYLSKQKSENVGSISLIQSGSTTFYHLHSLVYTNPDFGDELAKSKMLVSSYFSKIEAYCHCIFGNSISDVNLFSPEFNDELYPYDVGRFKTSLINVSDKRSKKIEVTRLNDFKVSTYDKALIKLVWVRE